jgi:hypothetical protein
MPDSKGRPIRIKFLANGPIEATREEIGQPHPIAVNPAPWMMKHYHDLHGRAAVHWMTPDYIADRTPHDIVDELLSTDVDVLLLPCFVWNHDLQMSVAALYKSGNPAGRVIVGGPQLVAHKDKDFFRKFPYVDYAVYGDGERALTDILDYLVTGERGPWVNTVEKINGHAHVWPFEVLRDELYWSTSPYLSQKQYIKDSLQGIYDKGYTNRDVILAVEFARGCMYRCAYCDWSQNLTKKVTRRKADWREELDFFKDLDVAMRETDANFGQWEEDMAIYDYARQLHDPERNFRFLVWNTAKLKKNADHFMVGNVMTYDRRAKLSVEDTEEQVLKAIGRPSLPWSEHQALLARVRSRLGEERFQASTHAELMLGLPMQTLDTFKENYTKLVLEGIFMFDLNHWVYAINSPGASPAYLKQHGIEFTEHRLYNFVPDFETTDTWYQHQELDNLAGGYEMANASPLFLKQQMVLRTKYMSMCELMTVKQADNLIQGEIISKQLKKTLRSGGPDLRDNIHKIISQAFDKASRMTKPRHDRIQPLINKYGFVLPDWKWHDKG